jgi:hypothetical protein
MAIPEEDLPKFPVIAAEALAGEFKRLADRLDKAIKAQHDAGVDLPEFQGAVADVYRTDLARHVDYAGGVIEAYRHAEGRIRDAVAKHRATRLMAAA